MKISIGYLYYDLLNLYGENGNIKMLKKELENQDIEVKLDLLSADDKINFKKYDFIYIGSGIEIHQEIAIKHLLQYKDDIKDYIEEGKVLLATGNSIELFGKYIESNKKIKALGIFKYNAKRQKTRGVSHSLFKSDLFEEPFIGFQNQLGTIDNIKEPFFKVFEGFGSYQGSKFEGINYKNFFATYLLGPILVRNPHFLKHIVKTTILNKKKDFKFKDFDLELETRAYNTYIQNFHSN